MPDDYLKNDLNDEITERLIKLKKAYDEGIITEEIYNNRRKEMLSGIVEVNTVSNSSTESENSISEINQSTDNNGNTQKRKSRGGGTGF